MSRQDANAAFALTSFLYGGNAAYIDEIYGRYEKDPASVDVEWQEFFKSLKDQPADVAKNAQGPSWEKSNWPVTPAYDLTSALDGNWVQTEKSIGGKLQAKAQAKGGELSAADVQQATRDSIRALMLIRAYRMRGNFYANLDPLGIEAPKDHEELDPRSYGFTDADYDRKIFLDHVLGLEFGTRSIDPLERKLLAARAIERADMPQIAMSGAGALIRALVARVTAAGGLLHVSFDVDFLDPAFAPGAGTTVAGGATVQDAEEVMITLAESGLVRSVDIVELNPLLDRGQRTARLAVELTARLLGAPAASGMAAITSLPAL